MAKTTVCNSKITEIGYLIVNDEISNEKTISYEYRGKLIYFSEEICKKEFLESDSKEEWMENHQ